jgi:hypothetical protein
MKKLHRIGVVTTVSLAAVLTPMAVAHGVNIPDAAIGRDANGLNAFRYTPDVLPADGTTVADQIITKGESITWTHLDTRPAILHSVTSGAPSDTSHEFDSGLLGKDGTFTQAFDEVGTFPYFCKRQNAAGAFVHHAAGMKGVVHVLHNFTYRGPSEQVAQSGSVIPVKFTLHGFEGLGVIRQALSTDLDGGGGVPAQTPGHSALSYDADTDTYTYLWKTDRTWAGQTREFSFQFNGDSNEPVRTVTTVNFR